MLRCQMKQPLLELVKCSLLLQGEICLCTSRIFVEESIFDDFVKKFVDGAKNLSVGDPKDDNSFMGALISEAHLNKVQVRDGK